MGDYTQVNAGAMSAGLQDLQQAHTQLTSTLEELDGELKSSLAQWDGEAKNAYYEAQAKWNAAAQNMGNVIAKMNAVLGTITDDYGSTEKTIQARFA